MCVVKESLGLGHPPEPHPLGFSSGKELGGGFLSRCRFDFYTKKLSTSANPELGLD